MDIFKLVESCVGKDVKKLQRLSEELPVDASTIRELIPIARDEGDEMASAATWLVKRFCEQGKKLTPKQTLAWLDLLESVGPWAKLHILQSLPLMKIPSDSTDWLYRVLSEGLDHKGNTFVKAWTYNGLAVLADQHADFRDDVLSILDVDDDAPASIKARIRNIRKDMAWADVQ